jgi:hypothetical protein
LFTLVLYLYIHVLIPVILIGPHGEVVFHAHVNIGGTLDLNLDAYSLPMMTGTKSSIRKRK